jgi:hypothetical protein
MQGFNVRNLELHPREEKIGSFQAVTGIRDRTIVESLVDAGFEMSTLTAFIWAPVVFVAWADGNADQLEKAAILDALPNKGLSREIASMMIAHEWFANHPTEGDKKDMHISSRDRDGIQHRMQRLSALELRPMESLSS